MKEIIGKSKVFHQNLPNNLKTSKTSVTDKTIIADKFNEHFINIGSNLTAKIPPSNMSFDSYITHVCTIFAEKSVTEEELKRAFFSFKFSKTPVYDTYKCQRCQENLRRIKSTFNAFF